MSALDLRLYLGTAAMRIGVSGKLQAANAHLLSKVVVHCLRRYAMPSLEIDLTNVAEVDHVGVAALLDCERCARRRGVMFTLVGVPARLHLPMSRMGARALLPLRRFNTGTFCLRRRG